MDIMLKTGMNLDHFWLKNKLFKNGLLYVTCWAVSIVGHGQVYLLVKDYNAFYLESKKKCRKIKTSGTLVQYV